MKTEDTCKANTVIGFILMALVFINVDCWHMTFKLNNLESKIQTVQQEFETEERQYAEDVEHLYDEIERLDKRLDEMITSCYDYEYVVRVVAAESRGESIEGQKAVAQTILERSLEWGMTPEQVVKSKWQYASPVDVSEVPEDTWRACNDVLIHHERVFEEPVKWFYNPSRTYSAMHEGKQLAGVIGAHSFYY